MAVLLAGSNTWGAWSATNSFIVNVTSVTGGYEQVKIGSTWTPKSVKTLIGGVWTATVDN